MAADQFEHQVRSRRDGIDDARAAFRSVVTQDRVLSRLQIRHHLAEGTARCAPTDFVRFQHGNVDACLGQVQGGGQAGEAGADDSDSNMALAFERLRDRRRWCVVDVDGGWAGAVGEWFIHAATMRLVAVVRNPKLG